MNINVGEIDSYLTSDQTNKQQQQQQQRQQHKTMKKYVSECGLRYSISIERENAEIKLIDWLTHWKWMWEYFPIALLQLFTSGW